MLEKLRGTSLQIRNTNVFIVSHTLWTYTFELKCSRERARAHKEKEDEDDDDDGSGDECDSSPVPSRRRSFPRTFVISRFKFDGNLSDNVKTKQKIRLRKYSNTEI